MKNLIFVFLAAFAAHAQTPDEVVLGYAEDIQINGKVFERYQTPKGDNVLIGKEDAKRRGVFLFNGAKKLLQGQGTIELGVGAFAHNTYTRIPEAAFEALKVPGQTYVVQKTNVEGDLLIGWRPTFYRHIRVQGEFSFFPWHDLFGPGEPEPQNQRTTERWLKLSNQIYAASFDHDIIVIPGASNSDFHAFSLGYFVVHSELQRFNDKKNGEGWVLKEASLPWNDSGPVINYRWATNTPGATFSVNVQGQFGTKGTKRIVAGVIVGFGGQR